MFLSFAVGFLLGTGMTLSLWHWADRRREEREHLQRRLYW